MNDREQTCEKVWSIDGFDSVQSLGWAFVRQREGVVVALSFAVVVGKSMAQEE
jgi:hypothetical protein